MTHPRTTSAETVKRLALPLALLTVLQFLHGLAPAPEGASEEGGLTGFIGGIGFLLATGVAAGAAAAGRDWARSLARLLGLAIPIGFVLYHGAWFNSPVTNPYWGDGSATGWQWATLPPVMAVGAFLAFVLVPRLHAASSDTSAGAPVASAPERRSVAAQ
ncbi:MAG: hypothetical protein HYU28_11700 [Actinobacteria bacterium]|nr:hypothetical protein [Actinomycetota bacterium]